MVLKKAEIFISGDVQLAGFRTFIKNLADSLDVKGYADNLPDGRVQIVCEGEEEDIAELADSVNTKAPPLSRIDDIQIKYGEYRGEFLDFERRGKDVPKKATLDDLLNVMVSFDNKAEKIVVILGDMKVDLADIKNDTRLIPAIRENTDLMLEKQDITINVLKGVKEDTTAIRHDTGEMTSKLWNKYEELSKEVNDIKITLSKIEAKVMG